MKRIFGVLLLFSAVASGMETEFSADLSMNLVEAQKPSSVQDQTAFQMPEARFFGKVTPLEDVDVLGEVDYGKSRDSVDGQWNLQVQRAYFNFQKIFSSEQSAQYGLIPQPWSDLEDRFWDHRELGVRGAAFAERYGYISRSDLGVAIAWGPCSFSIVNGEGATAEERGPHKEFQFTLDMQPVENWTVAFAAIEGNYDNIDADVAQKERFLLLLGFEQPKGWQGSLQWMQAKDPVDKVSGILADKVDLAAQGGQVARSQGGTAILKNRWAARKEGAFYEGFLRWDILNPSLGVSGKGLQQRMLGFGFFPHPLLQFSLAWSQVFYENNFAASVEDVSEILVAARLRW